MSHKHFVITSLILMAFPGVTFCFYVIYIRILNIESFLGRYIQTFFVILYFYKEGD